MCNLINTHCTVSSRRVFDKVSGKLSLEFFLLYYYFWGTFFLELGLRILKKVRVDGQAQTPLGILAKFLAESELDKYFLGSCAVF